MYIGSSKSLLIYGSNKLDDIIPDGIEDTFDLSTEVPGGYEGNVLVVKKTFTQKTIIASTEVVSFDGTTEKIILDSDIMGLLAEVRVGDVLTISGASNGANNGTFEITAISSDGTSLEITLDTNLVTEAQGASITIVHGSAGLWEILKPEQDYTVGGTGINLNRQITFSSIPTEDDQIYVVHKGEATYNFVPSPNSVGPDQLSQNLRNFALDKFVGDNAEDTFTLSDSPVSGKAVIVTVDGEVMDPKDEDLDANPGDYLILNDTIVFDTPPANLTKIRVLHLGFSTVSRRAALSPGQVGAVADGSITANKIATSAVTSSKIDSSAVTTSKIASDAVTGTKILLDNNQALRGKKADTTATDIIKIAADDNVEINSAEDVIVKTNSTNRIKFSDTTIEPVTTNQVDLGATAKRFKDAYLSGNADVTGNVTVGGNIVVTGTVDGVDIAALSALVGGVDVLSLQSVVNALIPAGNIFDTARATAPAGYLMCDGSAVSRVTYSTLFAAIGTTFGIGDGSTTFNVPDFRGRFALGKAASGTGSTLAETGGAIDHTHTGGAHTHTLAHTHNIPGHYHGLGTLATVAAGSHNHAHATTKANSASVDHQHGVANHTHTGSADSGGAHYHNLRGSYGSGGTNGVLQRVNSVGTTTTYTGDPLATSDGSHSHTLTIAEKTGLVTNSISSGTTAHEHSLTIFTDGSHSHTFTGVVGANASGKDGNSSFGPTTDQSTDTTSSNGAVATTSNNPPFLVINKIIKT